MRLSAIRNHLFGPVDIASLVVFRVMFGAIMLWEVWRYLDHQWIKRYYIDPDFHFKYWGFEWVQPWPGFWMYIHFAAMALFAVFIIVGFLYRLSAALFFMLFTYMYLLDQALYLNHFYLVCLMSFLLIFVPAHRARSVDAALRPKIRSEFVPAWSLWVLRAQMALVYFYAGVAKINADWLRGAPLRDWLGARSKDPLLGWIFREEWGVMLFSYGGLMLDLLVAPALLWRRTRVPAFLAILSFHLLNARLFDIGIFPWFALAATLLFFSPDWPRRFCLFSPPRRPGDLDARPTPPICTRWAGVTMALLGIYLAFQVLFPLRHFLYPGVVHWTEEGHRFAWHMKLRSKTSKAKFFATDPATGRTWQIKHRNYLTSRQRRKMASHPFMIHQFSYFLADELRREGYEQIEIRVEAFSSLNGRKSQLMIDPQVDLAGQPRSLLPAAWILPLTEPLPDR